MNVAEHLDNERKSLLQLSGSSPSINLKDYKAKGLQLHIYEPAKFIFDIIEGSEFVFIPKNTELPKLSARQRELPYQGAEEDLLKRLQKTKAETKLAQEEHGVNILNIAVGLLHWKEDDKAEKYWRSPLVIIPVKLERDDSKGKTQYSIRYNEEAIEPNHALVELLKNHHHISLPPMPDWESMEGIVQTAESWNSWIQNLKDLAGNYNSWKVNEQESALSFFTFAKFQMYKDLSADNWRTELGNEPITIAKTLLSNDGFPDTSSIYSADFYFDKELPADQPTTIEKLDSSQARALLEARKANALLIEGPPGTGKSTTIANMIADAVLHDKKVLFVAEKMAALDAVKRIFERNQLGHLCLELHGSKTQKTVFLEGIRSTIEQGNITASLPKSFDRYKLNKERDELRNWSDIINLPGKNGYSAYELFGLLLNLRHSYDTSQLVQLGKSSHKQLSFSQYATDLTKEQFELELADVKLFTEHLKAVGQPLQNIFYGCEKQVVPLPTEEHSIVEALVNAQQVVRETEAYFIKVRSSLPWIKENNIASLAKAIQALSILVSVPELSILHNVDQNWQANKSEIEAAIAEGENAVHVRENLANRLHENAWNASVNEHTLTLSSASDSIWNRWFNSKYKKSKNFIASLFVETVPKDKAQLLSVANAIINYQGTAKKLSEASSLKRLYGDCWQGVDSDWIKLKNILDWQLDIAQKVATKTLPKQYVSFLKERAEQYDFESFSDYYKKLQAHRDHVIKAISLVRQLLEINPTVVEQWKEESFAQLHDRLEKTVKNIGQLPSWIWYYQQCKAFNQSGKDWLLQAAETWQGDANWILPYYQYSIWEHMLQQIMQLHPAVQQMSHHKLDQLRASFIENDTLLQEYYKVQLINKHAATLQSLGGIGQAGFVRKNLHRKRNIPAIRKFLQESFDAISAIKPVFMMSPLSVAGYLETQPGMFDLVIFDEASQVEPMDALGAIFRGKQVVVVGDTKQMPPSNFFKKVFEDGDDTEAEDDSMQDMQSIMEVMMAKNAPNQSLQWHYRSQHQSLIETSRAHFYKNMLVYHRASEDDFLGLKLVHLDHNEHPYDGSGVNKVEARVVAMATLAFIKQHPDKSLGVVAFNIKQRDCIEKEVELLAKDNPELKTYISSKKNEELFIKNLENVQGDERDVIFISLGYGKTKDGSFSHNFGPLNKEGGERRFNVLITRARMQNRVFANFSYADIDISRTSALGVKVLKDFLHYAEVGKPLQFELQKSEANSLFEEQVMVAINNIGYDAECQLGSKGYKIDIAVKHPDQPGRYVLAVECDGAAYHASKSARDRDRLRQSILEQYGWTFYRIWSSDWFFNQHSEKERLKTAIQAAIEKAGNNSEAQKEQQNSSIIVTGVPTAGNGFKEYEITPMASWQKKEQFLKKENPLLERYMLHVIHAESPVHIDRIFQRLTSFQGIRLGRRIRQVLEAQLNTIITTNNFQQKADFVWTNRSLAYLEPRDHSFVPDKDIDRIAPEELLLALETVAKSSFGADDEEIIIETLKKLGFSRVSDEMVKKLKELRNT